MSAAASRAIKLAAKTRQRLLGLKATYTRGENSSSIRVVPGRSAREAVVGDAVVKLDTRDLLIIAGELVKPERHDQITVTVAGQSQTFEAAPLTSNAQPWEWVDVYGVELRVHVQQID